MEAYSVMVYLDTHAAVWLYEGKIEILSEEVKSLLESESLYVSPAVKLEIQYLFEVKKIKEDADAVVASLQTLFGVEICQKPFPQIIDRSISESWTRDPFDRIITAQAKTTQSPLITKDTIIQKHYPKAIW